MPHGPILVMGATGAQGGAVVNALLAAGRDVRALVRDTTSAGARSLTSRGVRLSVGDFDDRASLDAAAAGAAGVFSVQLPPSLDDPEREIRTGRALADAAHAAGVAMFVHSSVARAGDQRSFAGWQEGRWWKGYWDSKSAVNEIVASRGFAHHCILKPAFMMDNFAMPKARGMFPGLEEGRLATAFASDTRLDLIAAADIGRFAAAAFADPVRFAGASLDLAAEALTMEEIGGILSTRTGRRIRVEALSEDEALRSGINSGLVSSQLWSNVEGYRVDLASVRGWGVPLTSMTRWADGNLERIAIV